MSRRITSLTCGSNSNGHKPLKIRRGRELAICVEKFSSPYDFVAKVLRNRNSKKFAELKGEIESHFNDHYLFSISTVSDPEVGQHCIARTKDGLLHRAIIIKIFVSSSEGFLSHCALVDEAKHACVPNRSLYETPDWVWSVPIQSGCFGLYGIIPSKLRPDYFEDTVKKVPCSASRWDPAAIAYLMKTCTSGTILKAVVMETDDSGVVWVNLFLPVRRKCSGERYLSINQELVRMEFAALGTRDDDCLTNGSSLDGLRWLSVKVTHKSLLKDGKEQDSLTHSRHENCQVVDHAEGNCDEIPSGEHAGFELTYKPKQTESKQKLTPKKHFTKNGVNMRSIGLQVGGDAYLTDECSEDEPLCKNFSCNITESELDAALNLKKCSSVVKAVCMSDKVSQNIDKGKKDDRRNTETSKFHDNDFLKHVPFVIDSEDEISDTSTSEKHDEEEDSEADDDRCKIDVRKSAQGPVKSVFVPDKLHSGSVVLLRGSKPPNPLPLFCKTPFSAQFLRILETHLHLRGPKLIQAYVWPAIMEKRDVIAIAPACGGKSLAYVVPIAHMLVNDNKLYGNEQPYVIIITPNWTKAEKLRNMFEKLLETSHRHHNVVTVCGGSPDEHMKASILASGCSVLICSAPSFVRICYANHIDLSRLKHIVFDCVHVLVEEFFENIKSVMRILANSLRTAAANSQPLKPPQIIGMGSRWTRGIESYMKTFMKNRPLLLISDPLEAAVFGKVQHKLLTTNFKDRLAYLQDFFSSYDWEGAVAVFTDTPKSVEAFTEIFKSQGLYSVKAHGNMSHGELDLVQQQLSHESSQLILFATDDVVPHLDIYSIKTVVHLTLPNSQHEFGVRLSVMQEFFDNDITGPGVERGRSIFLINEQEADKTPDLVKFFERIPLAVSDKLLSMAEEALKGGRGVKTSIPLCPTLMFLGICSDESVCKYRHRLTPSDKMNEHSRYSVVPKSGHVRVKVSHVRDATHYFGVCLAVKDDSGVITKFHDNRMSIAKDVEECLKSSGDEILLSNDPYPGVMYGTTKTFRRVVVLRLSKPEARGGDGDQIDFVIANYKQKLSTTFVCWNTPAGVRKVCVRFVDSGRVGVVRCDELFKIPNDLQSISWQAIEIRVCGIRPNDRDRKWLPLADHLVHENIFNKDLEGMVVAALGHTIWISPAVVRCKLPITKTIDTEFSVVQELLQRKFAQKYPEQVELISNFVSGKLKIDFKNSSKLQKPVKRFPPANNQATDIDVAKSSEIGIVQSTLLAGSSAVKDVECDVADHYGPSDCSAIKQQMRDAEVAPRSLTANSEVRNVKCLAGDNAVSQHAVGKQLMIPCATAMLNGDSAVQNKGCTKSDKDTNQCSGDKQQRRYTPPAVLIMNSEKQNGAFHVAKGGTSPRKKDEKPMVERVRTCQTAKLKNSTKYSTKKVVADGEGVGVKHCHTKTLNKKQERKAIAELDDSDKSLESLCKRFCDMPLSESDRMNILLEIHVSAVGCFYDLSIEDLQSLANVLPATRTVKEALTVVGALLSLILDDVPIANSIALAPLVATACSLKVEDEDSRQLAVMLFKLTQAFVESFDVNARVDPGVLSQASLMEIISELEQYLRSKIDDRVSEEANQALKMAREHCLLQSWPYCGVSPMLLEHYIPYLAANWAKKKSREVIKDQGNPQRSRKRSVSKKQPKPIGERYGINYDRFQDITTETTDVESVKALYTPIPVKFETDMSSSDDSDTI